MSPPEDCRQPVAGNPDIVRFQVFCLKARRKDYKRPFHTTVELYDVLSLEEARERFESEYDIATDPSIKEVTNDLDPDH